MGIYACSDIHGQYDLFMKMLEKIRFCDEDTLFILGDIIDRGPRGIDLLRYIMQHSNMHALIGNHEYMMYCHYAGKKPDDPWMTSVNGAKSTILQMKALTDEEKISVFDYIRRMYFQIEVKINDTIYLLSHASYFPEHKTIRWSKIQDKETLERKLWESPWRREEFLHPEYYKKDGRMHVIGHVPVQYIEGLIGIKPKNNPQALICKEYNFVNIDLGCAMVYTVPTAGLCCMDLARYEMGESAFEYFV